MTEPLAAGMLAQLACLLEATARKPGNVHRFADFADSTWLDFALSAAAIAPALDQAAAQPLGSTIERAVAATRGLVGSNTNLGMILLLAPLAAVPPGEPLRSGVLRVLDQTTVADARAVFAAIRRAEPGGLGQSNSGQDIAEEPTMTLVEVMRLASHRDGVARAYATGFAAVFDRVAPALRAGLARPGWDLETAIVAAFVALLAAEIDTLIARKRGLEVAREASRRAAAVVSAGWPDRPGSGQALADLDGWLRADGHARNPGTTADLIAAALFVCLRDGSIARPIATGWGSGGFDLVQ